MAGRTEARAPFPAYRPILLGHLAFGTVGLLMICLRPAVAARTIRWCARQRSGVNSRNAGDAA